MSRQFVAASSNQLRLLCERRLEDLNLVVLMIDGIHFGGQVLVVALGIAEGGEKHVLGVWQGATETAALDGYRAPGGGEKVPTHQRLSRTLVAEGTPESFGHSAERGADSRSRLNFDDPSCAVVVIGLALHYAPGEANKQNR